MPAVPVVPPRPPVHPPVPPAAPPDRWRRPPSRPTARPPAPADPPCPPIRCAGDPLVPAIRSCPPIRSCRPIRSCPPIRWCRRSARAALREHDRTRRGGARALRRPGHVAARDAVRVLVHAVSGEDVGRRGVVAVFLRIRGQPRDPAHLLDRGRARAPAARGGVQLPWLSPSRKRSR